MEEKVPDESTDMSVQLTPRLSEAGIAEIIAELEAPPADTPERRATFARARAMAPLVEQVIQQTRSRKT